LYPDWFPQWILDFATINSAIIVSPNYRLMPESNASDMLEDVSDFWTWINQDLQLLLSKFKPGLDADLTRVIVHGGSAGGTLAIRKPYFYTKLLLLFFIRALD
jgi:acetyl esterase/lipase